MIGVDKSNLHFHKSYMQSFRIETEYIFIYHMIYKTKMIKFKIITYCIVPIRSARH